MARQRRAPRRGARRARCRRSHHGRARADRAGRGGRSDRLTVVGSIASLVAAGWTTFEHLDGRFLAGALALQLANLAFRSLVWRNVLAAAYPERRVPYGPIAGAYLAGMALNAFVPARGGDVAKLVLVRLQLPWSSLGTVAASFSVLLVLDGILAAAIVGALAAAGALPALPGLPGSTAALAVAGTVLAAGAVVAAMLRARPAAVRRLGAHVRQGVAILASPRRYATTVLPYQLCAWTCRIGVVALALAAFRVEAPIGTAALLVVLNGVSTAVPVPGGMGSQQALAVYALRGAVPLAGAVTFSLGLQLGITAVNTVAGVAALMLIMRARDPLAAVRSGLALVRAARAG